MAAFLKIAGVPSNVSEVEHLKAFRKAYRELPKQISPKPLALMPPKAAPMPPVQFPVGDRALVPAQLPQVKDQFFVMAQQDGMVGYHGPDLGDLGNMLDDAYVMPLVVNGQPMMVGLPRSEEGLFLLAGMMEQLNGQQEARQDRPSSVHIEEVVEEDQEPAAGAPPEAAAAIPAPEPVTCCDRLVDIFCMPFRCIYYVVCLPFRCIRAVFTGIGRFLGLCS